MAPGTQLAPRIENPGKPKSALPTFGGGTAKVPTTKKHIWNRVALIPSAKGDARRNPFIAERRPGHKRQFEPSLPETAAFTPPITRKIVRDAQGPGHISKEVDLSAVEILGSDTLFAQARGALFLTRKPSNTREISREFYNLAQEEKVLQDVTRSKVG